MATAMDAGRTDSPGYSDITRVGRIRDGDDGGDGARERSLERQADAVVLSRQELFKARLLRMHREIGALLNAVGETLPFVAIANDDTEQWLRSLESATASARFALGRIVERAAPKSEQDYQRLIEQQQTAPRRTAVAAI